MTSLSIDTAAWVAPPDPVLELDALARQLEVTASRLEEQTTRRGWPVTDGAGEFSEVTARSNSARARRRRPSGRCGSGR